MNVDPQWLLLALLLITCTITGLIWSIYPRRKKLERFASREDMTTDEFYTKFYSNSGLSKDIVIKTLQDVAITLDLSASKLRPEDRFDRELAPVPGWEFDDEIGVLSLFAERHFKKLGVKVDLSKLKTLDDYIRCCSSQEH